VTDTEIINLASECGVIALRKLEFDGKQFNHTDDLLDGDAAGLVQFARLLLLKREWVGLATGEAREFYESDLSREELIHKIDEFLQEKNS